MKRLALCCLVVAAALLSGCGLVPTGTAAGAATGAPVYHGPSAQPGAR